MSKNPQRFLRPIKQLPRNRRGKTSFYDEILREFIYSGLKCAEVKKLGRKPSTVKTMLKKRLKKRKVNIRVLVRNKKVYLEKVNEPEQISATITRVRKDKRVIKYSIDLVTILDTTFVKVRCTECGFINPKDTHKCGECGQMFYTSEDEYRHAIRSMEKLEMELNSGK